jgi:demethylmenaquinone methyltransferase/2-methoxy-6-polyprenyl-1,4-benzoquinol methylase
LIEYYERRAPEYDRTAWEHPDGDHRAASTVQAILTSLPPARTLDIGCGTGYVSRWLPGNLTLLDASASMLSIARQRLSAAQLVRAIVPALPFADHSFKRVFSANLFGHLPPESRKHLASEMRRVAQETVVLDQVSENGVFQEGLEERQLLDGSKVRIHKCYFTTERLLSELGAGDILMDGPVFAILRLTNTEK